MKGKVYLIGAGPGDAGLITLKGSMYLKEADVVVYDRLASPKLLEELKEGCRLIYVGKASSNHTKTQDEINEIIFQEANKGHIVARLKGGDPYVFGRGGEEAEYLYDRGIDFEVVPGVTSAIAGLAYAGIPITHRGIATSFHVITGHLKDENDELDWRSIGALKGTLVFLMGVSNLKEIRDNLLKHGKDKQTPVAIVNWGTTPMQQVVEGNLSNIYEKAIEENIKPPSLIVIGDVVNLRKKLNFYERKPLLGKNIVVTREKTHAIDTIKRIEELGGNVISFPTIKIEEIRPNEELNEAIRNIKRYSYMVFTSIRGVDIFFKRFFDIGEDIRNMAGIKIGAVGDKTANAIRKYGINVDFIPEEFVGESLVDKLKKVLTKDDKVLITRAKIGRRELVEELSKISLVHEIKIYDTVKSEESKEEIINSIKDLDSYYLLFTSSSTFTNFIEILGDNRWVLDKGQIISIGPITTKTIEERGFTVYKQAETYTVDGILELLMKEKR